MTMRDRILNRFAWLLVALGILILLLLGFAESSRAQGNAFPPDNGPYRSGQITLLPQNAVPLITFASISPTTQTGTTSYYYWIVTHDVTNARFSIPAGPFFTSIGPPALSATASIKVQWTPYSVPLTYGQTSANATPFTAANITYDVLETATPAPPTGACACAVATGLQSASATDTGTLGAYTVNVPAWPGNYPLPGDLVAVGPKGSIIDGGPSPAALPYPIVVLGPAGWAAAQAALPQTGGASGLGGGTIDARACVNLSSTATDFGTFTQTVPLTILLGPCTYNFNRILLGNPGGNVIPFHMQGCGTFCSLLLGTDVTANQALITQASANQTQFDVLFQDFAIVPSGTAGQDVFNFTPTGGNSLNGFVFQRLLIGLSTIFREVTGSAIKIDKSAQSNGVNFERLLIDDNHIEEMVGVSNPAISLIGSLYQGVRITHNHFETAFGTTPSGTGIFLASASATSYPSGVVIESNTFSDSYLTMIEADGAVGILINGNTLEESFTGTRNGILMNVGTGTVHSSLNVTNNTFNATSDLAYVLKTTDASSTATFEGNVITGTPASVFSGFTNNLVARNNTGGGIGLAQWEGVLFANLATPNSGTFRYCSDCALTNPCTGSGAGAFAQRINGAWNCAPVPTNITGTIGGTPVTIFQILNDNTTFTCAGDQNVCTETLTWPVSMGDTSYTAVCSPHNPSNTTGAQGLSYSGLTITSATQFTVSIVSSGSASKSYGGMMCWGWHQ